jgi:outer membrane protein
MKKSLVYYWGLMGLLLLLGAANPMQAQEKIAYVDTDEIIMAMPEYKTTRLSLEEFQRKVQQELDDEKRVIAKYYTDVIEKVKEGSMTAKAQQEAEEKLQKMQSDLQLKANQADQRLVAKETKLTEPMYDKFEAALKAVARRNGYTYILDKKMLLFSGGIDATSQMKKELGL